MVPEKGLEVKTFFWTNLDRYDNFVKKYGVPSGMIEF